MRLTARGCNGSRSCSFVPTGAAVARSSSACRSRGHRFRWRTARGMRCCSPGRPVSVDLECLLPRDFAALLPWFADDAEQRWFAAQADARLAFYRLWTFKEALLKALGADFADLRSLSLETPAPPGLRWQRYAWLLEGEWLVSAVLASAAPLPPPRVVGAATVVTLPSF